MEHTAIVGICDEHELSMHEVKIDNDISHELRKAELIALAVKQQLEYNHLDEFAKHEFDTAYNEAMEEFVKDENLYKFKLAFENYYDIVISDPVFFKGHTY
jgi:hypothetical protein